VRCDLNYDSNEEEVGFMACHCKENAILGWEQNGMWRNVDKCIFNLKQIYTNDISKASTQWLIHYCPKEENIN
jgi:hypothetical protein